MKELNFSAIEKKWQEQWKKEKIFEPEINPKKKHFYIQVAYPYPSGAMHIGHARTYSVTDAIAKYHLMKGYNVLMPMGWHVSGTPVIAEVEALKRNDEKTIKKFIENFRIPKEDIKFLKEPESYVDYMVNKAEFGYKKGFQILGLGIDWRRELKTIDKQYNKFIQWQYRKLKEKGYLIKGKYPVRFCPNDNNPVGDHDLREGEGLKIIEFVLLKFPLEGNNKRMLIAATLRPETIFGQTNLWVNPETNYVIASIENEEWILSENSFNQLKNQMHNLKEIARIKGEKLIGKNVIAPGINRLIPVLPAFFIEENIGSGIVTSVPSDAPIDFIALKELQENKSICKQFNLNQEKLKEIKVIPIIETPAFGDNCSEKIINELKIKSQKEKEKLEQAKEIAYKEGFFKGRMNENCDEFAGMQVKEAKEKIKEKLLKEKKALILYQLEGKAVCRCGTEIIVKVLEDQWFVCYSNQQWKNESKKTLSKMKIIPEIYRKQYENAFEWLEDKPCTRSKGLGTRFPFDETKILEPLADSTIYMAYFTISHLIKKIEPEKLNDELFDFIFLGKGKANEIAKKTGIEKELIERMQQEFNYWYPLAFNSSAIELIPNHMSFSIFQHTAIFPEEKRQQGTLNLGMLILEGKKMSSSKGNVILINDICEKIGADNVRLFLMNSVEPWEEMNWQQKEVEKGINTMNSFLKAFYIEAMKSAKAKKLDEKKLKGINAWLYNKFNEHLNNYIDFMESFELRKAIQEITFKFFNDLKWYEHRIKQEEKPVELINYVISNWTKCIAPFMPHIAEEFWRSALLNKESIFLAGLPEKKKLNKTIEAEENIVRNTLNDAIEVIKLSKIEKPKKIILIVAAEWKKKAIELLAKKLNKIDLKEAMSILMTLKEAKENPKITERIAREFTQRFSELKELKTINEMKALNEAKSFFEKELNTAIEIIEEEKSTQIKAKNALPFKPAIVVE